MAEARGGHDIFRLSAVKSLRKGVSKKQSPIRNIYDTGIFTGRENTGTTIKILHSKNLTTLWFLMSFF